MPVKFPADDSILPVRTYATVHVTIGHPVLLVLGRVRYAANIADALKHAANPVRLAQSNADGHAVTDNSLVLCPALFHATPFLAIDAVKSRYVVDTHVPEFVGSCAPIRSYAGIAVLRISLSGMWI